MEMQMLYHVFLWEVIRFFTRPCRQQEVEAEQFVASIGNQIIQKGPIVFDQLQKYTKKDSILQEVVSYIKEGWPMKLTDARLKTYSSCKHQLSVNNGCLLKHGDNVRINKNK